MAGNGKAALGFILVTVLVDVVGFGLVIPVAPKLIMELTGADISGASTYGGWLMFCYAVMQFCFAPVLGSLSDRYGRRPVLLFSLFGFGVDYILLALAPTIGWFFLGRILAGITGSSFSTASAYVADISTPDRRAQYFGMIGATFGVGFIIGPLMGGLLGQFGTRVPFYASAVLTLLNWLYGYFVLPESLSPANRRAFSWKRANPFASIAQLGRYPSVGGLISSLILIYIAAHAVQTTWSYYNIGKFGWDSGMVGYSLAYVGLMVALVQGGLIRWVIPRFGNHRSLYAGLFCYSLGMFLFAFATQGWMMFAVCTVYCLGGIAGPALQGIISSQVPANEQGELQGALTSLMSATTIVGPPLMTSLYAHFTQADRLVRFPGAPFLMGGVMLLASALLAYRVLRPEGQGKKM